MIRSAFIVLIAVFMGAVSAPIFAHSQKAAITRVVFNARTSNLEVMHRFPLHDAEHAVKEIFDGNADIIGSEKTRAQFAEYVYDRFSIKDGTGKKLILTKVGHEVDGKFLWIYQEVKIPNTDALTIEHNALRELWPSQTNTVNIEGADGLKTATFAGSVELLTVTLDEVHSH